MEAWWAKGRVQSGLSFFLVFCILFHRFALSADNSLTPRGVPLSRASLYDPQKDFSCLDGTRLIPFSMVNDDYCDCKDGSDEPGTSACSKGTFYCLNAGHIPTNIPSSRVNDGICDCCDGTDEGPSGEGDHAQCGNTCNELGRAAREEAERQDRLAREGYTKRMEMGQRGLELRRQKEEEKAKLEAERQQAENVKSQRQVVKDEVEAPEREALDRIKAEEEEKRKQKEEAERAASDNDAEILFQLLDSNLDDKITMDEIQVRQTFDKNKDGQVDDEEARWFLNMEEEMSKEEFLKTGYSVMKPFFLMEQGMFQPPLQEGEEEEEHKEEPVAEPEEAVEDDELDDLEDPPNVSNLQENSDDVVVGDEPEEGEGDKYDPHTRALIDAAEKAREEYREAERAVNDVEKRLEEVNEALNLDFGEDERFAAMWGQCFDFEDREYVYTLCPYKSANQRARSGGSEVSLGKWGSWTGPEGRKYDSMLYDRGQSCWNGPTRSAKVRISCGTESRLVGVSEPSRCEYAFEFTSPAACDKPVAVHDEL